MTSNTSPILVFLESFLLVCDDSSSRRKVHSRQAIAPNCLTSPVSFVMKCSPTSTTWTNPSSIQNLLTLLSSESVWFVLDTVVMEHNDVTGFHSAKELLPWFHWEPIDCPSEHQVNPIYLDGFHIPHTCMQLFRKDRSWLAETIFKWQSQLLNAQQ